MTVYNGTCGTSVNWTLDDSSGVLDITGTGAMDDYSNFGNFAPWYDYCFDIKKCVVESGVTYIGNFAFYECEYMTEIVIGDSVTSFGVRAFDTCGLKRYTVSENNSVYSSDNYGVLFNKNKTEIIECRTDITVYEMPDSVEYITTKSFALGTGITSLTISKNIISIEKDAFRGHNRLTTIIFKSSTPPTMGERAFELATTATVYTTGWGSDEVFTTDIRGNYTTFIYETLASEPLSGTCGSNANFTLDFSTGILTISGTGAMTNYSTASPSPWYDYRNDITSVVIEDGITAIGNYAFYYHSAIPSITIPDSVTSIGKYAFASCSAATTVTIGTGVTLISQKAFYASKLVTEVNFLGDQPTLEENSFQMGFSSTSKATATVYSSGWASDDVFTSTVKGSYTTLTYERTPGVYFLGVNLSTNPVNTGVSLIVSVNLEVVTDSFTWDSLSTKTWNSVKMYTWNDLKGE